VGTAIHLGNPGRLIFSLEPVVAWALSYVLAGESLSNRGKGGAGLIMAGILLVELKRTKSERHHNSSEVTSMYNAGDRARLEE
jgi:drug/metabolite transporter (DMT)-like permease